MIDSKRCRKLYIKVKKDGDVANTKKDGSSLFLIRLTLPLKQ